MTSTGVDTNLIEEIASRLELRKPNHDAVLAVANAVDRHFADGNAAPREAIVDSATGVGKTYVIAGLVEYFAATNPQTRNFLILTPGRTINRKTIANFTRGDPRSLTSMLKSQPVLVTADNFDSPAVRSLIADRARTKVYVFTVQSLLLGREDSETIRKTHNFQEGLGAGFFEMLAGLDDLIVLADEHHLYAGPRFSAVLDELHPRVIVGLTATPNVGDHQNVVYRYPLAMAIAQQYVKTPVIVGRRDDRVDEITKLADGTSLLRAKARLAEVYCTDQAIPAVNPVMLISAKDITDAERVRGLIESESFHAGEWAGTTLLVHSDLPNDQKEETLAKLDAVDQPGSPVRIIIQVGMLKEGWDVKNVYVILSLRSSISEVLTEQTLGRGLRLPFGRYTGLELLDTLEVIAHERYQQLLERRNVLEEQFIETYLEPRVVVAADGSKTIEQVSTTVTLESVGLELIAGEGTVAEADTGALPTAPTGAPVDEAIPVYELSARQSDADAQVATASNEPTLYPPLEEREPIVVPKLTARPVPVTVSLVPLYAENQAQFILLGTRLRDDGQSELRRTLLGSKVQGTTATIRPVDASDHVQAALFDRPLDETRKSMIERIISAGIVERRGVETAAAAQLVDAVISGMGADAGPYLSNFFDTALDRILVLIKELFAQTGGQTSFEAELEFVNLDKTRTSRLEQRAETSDAYEGRFSYNGWKRNLYSHAWFDTSTEYQAARAIDTGSSVVVWARLHRNDVPIQWTHDGRTYNPDFVVVEDAEGIRMYWFVETKQDREMPSAEVQGKRAAAKVWAATATLLLEDNGGRCEYLLLSEQDVYDARGSWEKLKRFGSGN